MNEEEARIQAHAEAFASLGHAARIVILRATLQAHPEGLISSQIQEVVGLPASTLSHHLEALRQAGLLEMRREGRTRRYLAACDNLALMMRFLFDECCTKSGAVEVESCLPGDSCCD